jgi:hypothetical protein
MQEDVTRQQFLSLLADFTDQFPGVQPPISEWWQIWLEKYTVSDIREAIKTLGNHPFKARFTQISTGKAISALLRQTTIRRATMMPDKTAAQS